jgi:hypothetical protein
MERIRGRARLWKKLKMRPVGPTEKDGAGSQTPQFEFGVLKWILLHLEFWSEATSLGVKAMPNRPLVSFKVGSILNYPSPQLYNYFRFILSQTMFEPMLNSIG